MAGWWSGHRVVDPAQMEARFSNEDSMAFMDVVVTEALSEDGEELLRKVRSVMDRLPPREADFIEMYYFRNIKQTDIATIFGVSQPTVCYRLQRAASRIQFLLKLPEFSADEMLEALTPLLGDPIDVQVMLHMYTSTCQSEVAKKLGVSQGFVRHRFLRTISRLRQHEHMATYVEAFDMITHSLNILREVSRPSLDAKIIRIMA